MSSIRQHKFPGKKLLKQLPNVLIRQKRSWRPCIRELSRCKDCGVGQLQGTRASMGT